MTKKIIGFIHSVAEIGGAERVTEALMQGLLASKEFDACLFVPNRGPFTDIAEELGIRAYITPMPQPEIKTFINTIFQAITLAKLIKESGVSVLQAADLVCARAFLPAAKLAGIPVVCHMHFPVKADYVKWVFRFLPKPKLFIYCSSELKNATSGALQQACPRAIHDVIHNGVDVNRFKHVPLDNTIKRIGIIANLQERKGHIDFLNMAKTLLSEFDTIVFDIIGGDILQTPRQGLLEEYAIQLGIDKKLNFYGQVPNVIELLNNLDVLVCASHQEAFPISILEAMASQKAIVSTNVNGIPEAIIDEKCGLLVPPHQPLQLASSVARLLNNEVLAARLAKNARERVVNEFSQEAFIKKFIKTYDNIA